MPRILVVEDERLVARDLQNTLIGLGYSVLATAGSSDDALKKAEEIRPDLVLMDIRIQGARDGIETAALMNERWRTPVVYLTAYADEDTIVRARRTQPFGYLLKPYNERELRGTIEMALYKHDMEARLRASEQWFAATLRSIGEAVIAVDAQSQVKFMNAIAEALTGWKQREAAGRPIGEVFRVVDDENGRRVADTVDQAMRSGRVSRIERGTLRARNGAEVPIEDCAGPISAEGGGQSGAVLVFRDVRERRELEARLARTDRLAAMGSLVAGIAHEVNNPLSYITTNVGFAQETMAEWKDKGKTDGIADVIDALGDAVKGAEHIRRIVDDLRTFARGGEERGICDVRDVVDQALRMAAGEINPRARVERDYGENVPLAAAPSGRLAQVVLNILVNAAQALPAGKPEDNAIRVLTRRADDGAVLLSIADTGAGMGPEVLKRIFEPFFTTKPLGVGTGLGLSISHGIIRSLGGDITVRSEPGSGSEFTIRLPAAQGLTAAPKPNAVLVVDVDPQSAAVAARVLVGHEVIAASGAREALGRLTMGERFGLILAEDQPDLVDQVRRIAPEQLGRLVLLVRAGSPQPHGPAELPRLDKPLDAEGLLKIARTKLGPMPA